MVGQREGPSTALPSARTRRWPDEDEVVQHHRLGVPVTTDPDEIAAFLRRRPARVSCSPPTSPRRRSPAFALGRVPAFDLAVADEAHRCAGRVSSEFATILDAEQIKAGGGCS